MLLLHVLYLYVLCVTCLGPFCCKWQDECSHLNRRADCTWLTRASGPVGNPAGRQLQPMATDSVQYNIRWCRLKTRCEKKAGPQLTPTLHAELFSYFVFRFFLFFSFSFCPACRRPRRLEPPATFGWLIINLPLLIIPQQGRGNWLEMAHSFPFDFDTNSRAHWRPRGLEGG